MHFTRNISKANLKNPPAGCLFSFLFVPSPKGGREIRQYGRTLVSQGRASIGGASMELFRVVVVVVVVPLLLLVIEFASCDAS